MGQVLTKPYLTKHIGSAASLIFPVTKTGSSQVLRYSLLKVFYRHYKIIIKLEKSASLSFHGTHLKKGQV